MQGILRKNGQGSWALDNNVYATEENAVMRIGNQIINGERFPSPRIAKRISEELGAKFEDIFFAKSKDCL